MQTTSVHVASGSKTPSRGLSAASTTPHFKTYTSKKTKLGQNPILKAVDTQPISEWLYECLIALLYIARCNAHLNHGPREAQTVP